MESQKHASNCLLKRVSCKASNLLLPEGQPKDLRATETKMRRGTVLVLDASSTPHTNLAMEWHSTGLCRSDR